MSYQGMLAEVVGFVGADGDRIEGYHARPLGPGPFGSVVVIHGASGCDEWIHEVARRLAEHGYAALAPNFFYRDAPGANADDAAAATRAAGGVRDAVMTGDVDGAAKFLRAQPSANGKVGIIGFCLGGREVYLAACSIPDLDAAVDCWGGNVVQPANSLNERRPRSPIELTASLACPLLGLFGNDDANPDRAQVDAIEAELKRHNKTYEFHRYDGAGHMFMGWDRPTAYRTEAAVDAWKNILAFYGKHLQAPAAVAAGTAR